MKYLPFFKQLIMNLSDYQQHIIRTTDNGNPLTLVGVLNTSGSAQNVPNGSGYYEIVQGEQNYLQISDIVEGSANYPIIVSVSPAIPANAQIDVSYAGGAINKTIWFYMGATTPLGQSTHTINLSWDDGTSIRTGAIEFKLEVI